MASRGYDGGMSPPGYDLDTKDDGMFWDYSGDAESATKGGAGGAGGQNAANKGPKGSGKTLNKTEASLFAKWCREKPPFLHTHVHAYTHELCMS
jgi:hypothetical protein